MNAIDQVSGLYSAYLKGWDAALRRAAFIFDGRDRDAILSLVKEASIDDLTEDLRREAFFAKHGCD